MKEEHHVKVDALDNKDCKIIVAWLGYYKSITAIVQEVLSSSRYNAIKSITISKGMKGD